MELETRYEDLGLGLYSLVVAAYRFRTARILSFDERHVRAVVPHQGGSFTLVPADT